MTTADRELPASLVGLRTSAIVTTPRGSWKWQNAYKVMSYRLKINRDGRYVWAADEPLTGKLSMPQLRRLGYGDLHIGGMHHRPADVGAVLAAFNGFDIRPNEVLPKDHYS